MGQDSNLWAERFTSLVNREEIRRRAAVQPAAISGWDTLSKVDAGRLIAAELTKVFYPTEQCVDILFEWVSDARAHCVEMYGSEHTFIERIYLPEPPLPQFCFPICLTGLAGTGKSTLCGALKRLMPEPGQVETADGDVFPFTSYQSITIQSASSPSDVLVKLTNQNGPKRLLSGLVRKRAYRDGWALLLLDEFQFATQSSSASTRITQMLMETCYIGIPVVYVANFSMLHKLMSRNQEDQHRLLGKVRILRPESSESDDWQTLLRWYRDVAPEVFAFDPDADAEGIHHLTMGVKRSVVTLLRIAFERAFSASGVVTLGGMEDASRSAEFAPYRKDVEAMLALHGAFRNKRKDLWCPVDGVEIDTEKQRAHQRQKQVDDKALYASLSMAERKAVDELKKLPKRNARKPGKAKVVPMHSSLSEADMLREGMKSLGLD